MCLHIMHLVWKNIGIPIGLPQDGYLRIVARSYERFTRSPIVIRRTATNQGLNGIPIGQCLTSGLSTSTPTPSLRTYPFALASPNLQCPSGGQHTSSRKSERQLRLQDQVGPTNKRHTTFTSTQTLARKMESRERRSASRIHHKTWSLQIEGDRKS